MKISRIMMVCLLALGCQQADAQFGNLLNRVGYSARQSLENAAVRGAEDAGRKAVKSAKERAKQAKKDKADALTWSYGDHTYTMKGNLTADKYKKDGYGEVTFTNIPSDYDEFEALYSEFLGRTPHGTAAMIPMAMEMYGRNRAEGEKCIRLINYPSNVNSVLSQLKEKFGTNQYAPANDSYHQRYLPAAVLEGATPTNAYTPSYPYTVNMKASVNTHKDMQLYDGRVMYIYIMGKGWDTEQRSVEIVQTSDSELFKIFNCPALYTQCKNIKGTWEGLK